MSDTNSTGDKMSANLTDKNALLMRIHEQQQELSAEIKEMERMERFQIPGQTKLNDNTSPTSHVHVDQASTSIPVHTHDPPTLTKICDPPKPTVDSSKDALLEQIYEQQQKLEAIIKGKVQVQSELTKDLSSNHVPAELSSNKIPSVLSDIEVPRVFSSSEVPPVLSSNKVVTAVSSDVVPLDIYSNVVQPDLSSNEIPPDLSSIEVPPDLLSIEVPPDLLSIEVPPDLSSIEVAPDLSSIKVPPNEAATSDMDISASDMDISEDEDNDVKRLPPKAYATSDISDDELSLVSSASLDSLSDQQFEEETEEPIDEDIIICEAPETIKEKTADAVIILSSDEECSLDDDLDSLPEHDPTQLARISFGLAEKSVSESTWVSPFSSAINNQNYKSWGYKSRTYAPDASDRTSSSRKRHHSSSNNAGSVESGLSDKYKKYEEGLFTKGQSWSCLDSLTHEYTTSLVCKESKDERKDEPSSRKDVPSSRKDVPSSRKDDVPLGSQSKEEYKKIQTESNNAKSTRHIAKPTRQKLPQNLELLSNKEVSLKQNTLTSSSARICCVKGCPTIVQRKIFNTRQLVGHINSYHLLAKCILTSIYDAKNPVKFEQVGKADVDAFPPIHKQKLIVEGREFIGTGLTKDNAKLAATQFALEKLFNLEFVETNKQYPHVEGGKIQRGRPIHVGPPELWKQFILGTSTNKLKLSDVPYNILRIKMAALLKPAPEYKKIWKSHDDSDPLVCMMSVTVDGQTFPGKGSSQPLATSRAAQSALEKLYGLKFFRKVGYHVDQYNGDEESLKKFLAPAKKHCYPQLHKDLPGYEFRGTPKYTISNNAYGPNSVECTIVVEGQEFTASAHTNQNALAKVFDSACEYMKSSGIWEKRKELATLFKAKRSREWQLKLECISVEKDEEYIKIVEKWDDAREILNDILQNERDKSETETGKAPATPSASKSYIEDVCLDTAGSSYTRPVKTVSKSQNACLNAACVKSNCTRLHMQYTAATAGLNCSCPIKTCTGNKGAFSSQKDLDNHIKSYHVSADLILDLIYPNLNYGNDSYNQEHDQPTTYVTIKGKRYEERGKDKATSIARVAQAVLQELFDLAFTYQLGDIPRYVGDPEMWKKHVKSMDIDSCPVPFCKLSKTQFATKDDFNRHLLEDHRGAQQVLILVYSAAFKFEITKKKQYEKKHLLRVALTLEGRKYEEQMIQEIPNLKGVKDLVSKVALEALYPSFEFTSVEFTHLTKRHQRYLFSGDPDIYKQFVMTKVIKSIGTCKDHDRFAVTILNRISRNSASYAHVNTSDEPGRIWCIWSVTVGGDTFEGKGRNMPSAKSAAAQTALEHLNSELFNKRFVSPDGLDIPLYTGDSPDRINSLDYLQNFFKATNDTPVHEIRKLYRYKNPAAPAKFLWAHGEDTAPDSELRDDNTSCCCVLELEGQVFKATNTSGRKARTDVANMALTYLKDNGLYEQLVAESKENHTAFLRQKRARQISETAPNPDNTETQHIVINNQETDDTVYGGAMEAETCEENTVKKIVSVML